MSFKRIAIALVLVGFVCAAPSFAQATKPKDWYGYVQGGWADTEGGADRILTSGWTIGGGGTYWPTKSPVGLQVELNYNTFDVKNQVIDKLRQLGGDVSGGDVDVWVVGANLQWAVPTKSVVGFYLMGGVSADYIKARLTDTVGVIYCDPYYWWWCYPGTGTATKRSESEWTFGYQAGLGLSFKTGGGGLFYLEGRYHWMDKVANAQDSSAIAQIVAGFRF